MNDRYKDITRLEKPNKWDYNTKTAITHSQEMKLADQNLIIYIIYYYTLKINQNLSKFIS